MFDRAALSDALERHGRVVRAVIAAHKGSTPRETGAAMLVHSDGIIGTIGGGRLEYEVMDRAARLLADPQITGGYRDVLRQPLGPSLGQCCGGAVTVVIEMWDTARYREVFDHTDFPYAGIYLRQVDGDSPLPDRVHRRLKTASEASQPIETKLENGWLIEQLWRDKRAVYIYGAGHVGHALALTLANLPRLQVALVDVRKDLFEGLPDQIWQFDDQPPHDVMAKAPADAFHYIMTPDHDYDLELCHRVLQQPFAYAGLIGSATKWARFRKRLAALGHAPDQINRITCPIGDPSLGKHPHEIAIGVARALILHDQTAALSLEKQA
ncbi:xanthine dehydrogenase accessory protein XdhC [Aestuariivita boseongensis]|uniref:xanthine dehydrogenase accessory protein XdhC n=1 Tax=Aestuariivita boseongensis TaxID=1470562 RepID=UPI00068121C3|nr:xanthine dehydrogenase accessory protein XdhC [Aestuariivita boseongensis]